jgi:hypothetical protein
MALAMLAEAACALRPQATKPFRSLDDLALLTPVSALLFDEQSQVCLTFNAGPLRDRIFDVLVRDAFALDAHAPLPAEITVRYELGGTPYQRTIPRGNLNLLVRNLGVLRDGHTWALFQLTEQSHHNQDEMRPLYFLPVNAAMQRTFGDDVVAHGPCLAGRVNIEGSDVTLVDTPKGSAADVRSW